MPLPVNPFLLCRPSDVGSMEFGCSACLVKVLTAFRRRAEVIHSASSATSVHKQAVRRTPQTCRCLQLCAVLRGRVVAVGGRSRHLAILARAQRLGFLRKRQVAS